MPYFKQNENLVSIERLAERDVREMQRQLDLGSDEARAEFRQHRGVLEGPAKRTMECIEWMGERAEASLKKVRQELGRLNLMLSLNELDDDCLIDDYRERITQQVQRTRATLSRLEDASSQSLTEATDGLEQAWKAFVQRLELVRAQLKLTAQFTEQALQGERERLRASLKLPAPKDGEPEADIHGASADDHYRYADKPMSEFFARWAKGFFQHPDVAVPQPSVRDR